MDFLTLFHNQNRYSSGKYQWKWSALMPGGKTTIPPGISYATGCHGSEASCISSEAPELIVFTFTTHTLLPIKLNGERQIAIIIKHSTVLYWFWSITACVWSKIVLITFAGWMEVDVVSAFDNILTSAHTAHTDTSLFLSIPSGLEQIPAEKSGARTILWCQSKAGAKYTSSANTQRHNLGYKNVYNIGFARIKNCEFNYYTISVNELMLAGSK
jgi:hypothetical protein